MYVRVLGIQPVNFTNNNGEKVEGKNIFTAFQDENVEGLRTEKFFVKAGIPLPKDIKVNGMIDIVFNHKGRVEHINKTE